jgi:hypothetical protein
MNERIEELIIAYLHRGSTPEQERELFEACKTNAATANMLRQHLIMSLKLRQLRNETEVPLDVQNALLRRINETVISETPARVPAAIPARRGFGWAHLFGASLATAAAAVLVLFLVLPGTPSPLGPQTAGVIVRDTVLLTRTDTLVQVKSTRIPVYIVRNEKPAAPAPAGTAPDAANTPGITERVTPAPVAPFVDPSDLATLHTPSLAEARASEAPSFLEQYNAMLISVEKVRLTSSDRVRF